ncbi:MAG: response regulator [Comamonadaceae bacterium]|nr:response regulator [Comamonadaceae bacterium]
MTTRSVARQLGLAVRSVQLMVDRGELVAWRTPGGHRRIERQSVQKWQTRGSDVRADFLPTHGAALESAKNGTVLLIEDSVHFQNLVKLLLNQEFPDVALHVAGDGIVGLAMAGQLQPDVLIIDILLPSIDGATLITTLRSHPQFKSSQLIVLTSLDTSQLGPYRFALSDLPVVHKPHMVTDLPPLLATLLKASKTP